MDSTDFLQYRKCTIWDDYNKKAYPNIINVNVFVLYLNVVVDVVAMNQLISH